MQKCFYNTLFLMGLLVIQSMHAAEAPAAAMIILKGRRGKAYPVAKEQALKSGMLKGFMQQFGQENVIPLESEFSHGILGQVAAIMNAFHAHQNLHDKALLDAVEHEVKIDPTPALLKAFDYLDYEVGKQLIARTIAGNDAQRVLVLKQDMQQFEPLIARYYYLLKDKNLANVDKNSYGFSIQDYLEYQPRFIASRISGRSANLNTLRINDLHGLDQLLNKGQLQVLSLSNNQIQSIPASLRGLGQLQRLYLSNNRIQSIPANLQGLDQLQILYLNNNQIQSIPASLQGVGQLQRLYLRNNPISSLSEQDKQTIKNEHPGVFIYFD